MIIVTVNSGSTSIKLAAYAVCGATDVRQVAHEQQPAEGIDTCALLRGFLSRLPAPPDAMAHRIVHGGTMFSSPVLVDDKVLQAIGDLAELAPLHNPKAHEWLQTARTLAAKVPQVAAFDTSFFHRLPRVAAEYALASRYGSDESVRRYGFHGLAHEALWRRWCELNPGLSGGGRLISVQLGGGCSIAAIERGLPLDISMGFSPLEGLVMATRSGDVDAAIIPFLQRRLARTSAEILELLNTESGIAGLSGGETHLGKLAADPGPKAQFAVDLYCYRIRKYIGAYLAVLGGCDGIVFGGGDGEHVPAVRERILTGLQWAGVTLDPTANAAALGQEACISAADSRTHVHVIPVDEE